MARKREVQEDVWTLAVERSVRAFELFDQCVVFFSGGKDSTATLQVALHAAELAGKLPLEVHFIDEEAIPLQTEEYVRRVAQDPRIDLKWWCVPVKHRNACSRREPFWWTWAPESKDLWVRPMPPEGLTAEDYPAPQLFLCDPMDRIDTVEMNSALFPPDRYGNVGMFFGIRAGESLNRFRMVAQTAREYNYITQFKEERLKPKNLWKVYPVYDWTEHDVWTAPKLWGWDYNEAYDVMDKAGLTAQQQRCSPAYGEEPLERLWTYAVCFPEIWDRMTQRVPGAATAGRYARTMLYSYKSRIPKPADMSWEDYIKRIVQKWEQPHRTQVAKRVKIILDLHYKKTSDPLVENAPHPETGMSWSFVVMVAERGDFKFRKQAGGRISTDPERMKQAWAKYNAERAEMENDSMEARAP